MRARQQRDRDREIHPFRLHQKADGVAVPHTAPDTLADTTARPGDQGMVAASIGVQCAGHGGIDDLIVAEGQGDHGVLCGLRGCQASKTAGAFIGIARTRNPS